MKRLKSLRTVVWLITAIMAVELAMLVALLRPTSFYLWTTIGVIALMTLYLVRLCLSLILELKDRERDGRK